MLRFFLIPFEARCSSSRWPSCSNGRHCLRNGIQAALEVLMNPGPWALVELLEPEHGFLLTLLGLMNPRPWALVELLEP